VSAGTRDLVDAGVSVADVLHVDVVLVLTDAVVANLLLDVVNVDRVRHHDGVRDGLHSTHDERDTLQWACFVGASIQAVIWAPAFQPLAPLLRSLHGGDLGDEKHRSHGGDERNHADADGHFHAGGWIDDAPQRSI
jgi:hypothetical protein